LDLRTAGEKSAGLALFDAIAILEESPSIIRIPGFLRS
jgi:hypothetical protein